MNERLAKMQEIGQSVWIDSLSRDDIQNGDLQKLADEGVTGVTSNPTIFQKAISGSSLYDDQLAKVAKEEDDPKEIFFRLAVDDIRDACDIFRPVWEKTDGLDGYVSLEVSPDLAHDTQGTIDEAQRLFDMVDRPNLLVKIPATEAGLPAIEEMISRGRSINVTLIFSLERYRKVTDAYISGLKKYAESGGDPSGVSSVASFFISRVDSEADDRLEKTGRKDLQGRLAVDNARLAYADFERIFSGAEWDALAEKGANPQRPLWASTSTKNPDYSALKYVEALIGPNTVNTMPLETVEATMKEAEVANNIRKDVDDARDLMKRLEEVGVDYDDVSLTLEKEGVQKFADSFEELLDGIREKSSQLVG
ncbi:transaldolase [Rubrobacter indicoceani]|uniref:transaldolase n=1 Tax=Rubrobacter indicoceani TaxID=2051957 RepID=UPI000E5AD0C5|nr:transaldolase [Rubrobacter indicoceani]